MPTKTVPYSYRMPTDIREALQQIADKKRAPMSYLITAALVEFIKLNQPTL